MFSILLEFISPAIHHGDNISYTSYNYSKDKDSNLQNIQNKYKISFIETRN